MTPNDVETLTGTATAAVLVGSYLPAHDQVFDLAEQVAHTLAALHSYVESVRSRDQADAAVRELLDALRMPQYVPGAPG